MDLPPYPEPLSSGASLAATVAVSRAQVAAVVEIAHAAPTTNTADAPASPPSAAEKNCTCDALPPPRLWASLPSSLPFFLGNSSSKPALYLLRNTPWNRRPKTPKAGIAKRPRAQSRLNRFLDGLFNCHAMASSNVQLTHKSVLPASHSRPTPGLNWLDLDVFAPTPPPPLAARVWRVAFCLGVVIAGLETRRHFVPTS